MAESRNRGSSSLPPRSSEPERDGQRVTTASASAMTPSALERLSKIARSDAVIAIAAALGPNAQLHLVGGTVRDCLSNQDPHDLDLASVIPAEQALPRLEAAGLKVIPTGIKHGTLTIVHNQQHIELTTFRVPGPNNVSQYSDDILTDLTGRDFTANAVAFEIIESRLIDPFNGSADIARKRIVAVGSAEERFKEDPLRILRMVRLGPSAGWSIDHATAQVAQQLGPLLEKVSPERIRVEIERILVCDFCSAGLRALRDLNLLPYTLPELVASVGFEQNEFHIHDVFEHTLWVIERVPKENRLVRLAALFHDIGKPESFSVGPDGRRHFFKHEHIGADITKGRMEALKFSNDEVRQVTTLVRYHMRPLDCGMPGVRRLMRELGDLFNDWKTLKRADTTPVFSDEQSLDQMSAFEALVRQEEERVAELSAKAPLALTGHDLISLGVKPGPAMGAILRRLEDLIIENPEANRRDYLLSILTEEFINSSK